MQLDIIADLPLWLNVVSFIDNPSKYLSKYWSKSFANFLENNDKSSAIDSKSFQKLTDENVLPYVDAIAALVFLKEEKKYACLEAHFSDDSGAKLPKLTNLQKRCVNSLVEAKLELNGKKLLRQQATETMSSLLHVMETYMNRTLDSYGKEKTTLNQQMEAIMDRLKKVENKLKTEKEKYRALARKVKDEGKRHWL
jgi:flagellar capping protein FliD